MRWLQWSRYDLQNGPGGVEVHARCLHRELQALGVESQLSSDPADLKGEWDVIQTHGSSPLPALKTHPIQTLRHKGPVRVHTLHGTTLGRMAACNEWLWPGGYMAYGREWAAVVESELILAVHPHLHLLSAARKLKKAVAICGNGWDAAPEAEVLPAELEERLNSFGPFFAYVGRGEDPVKDTQFVQKLIASRPAARLVAVPGEGFSVTEKILGTGRLSSGQVLSVLRKSHGLLLSSRYEGLPLVILEALGDGVPVYASQVGGLRALPGRLRGLLLLPSGALQSWGLALDDALEDPHAHEEESRRYRSRMNRMLLQNWRRVAEISLEAVKQVRK